MNNLVNPDYTLKNLIESLAEIVSEDEKLTNEYLVSNNIDPKKVEASGEEFIKKLKGQMRLKLASEKLEHYKNIRSLFLFQKQKLTTEAKEYIASYLSQGNNIAYQSYYRKLDKLTENDCKEIQDEQAFLNYLDTLEE